MVTRAFVDGWSRVMAAPALIAGVFSVTVLLALPLTLALRGLISTHLGRSMTAEAVAESADNDWWQEFAGQATGLGTTFTPSVIGFAAVLENISGVFDARSRIAPIAATVALYLAATVFLSGGIIDRYARRRAMGVLGFFAACGVNFFRLLRLGAIAVVVYVFLFIYVHGWIFDGWYAGNNRELGAEGAAIAWRFTGYAAFALLLLAANLTFDFAKVRLVVEDRRSAVFALMAALGFLKRNGGRALALYAVNALAFLVLIAVWMAIAPGAGGAGVAMWTAFAVSQIYIVVRLALKLQFIASETALFQRLLAHAAYVSAPQPVWPEAPIVEEVVRSPKGQLPRAFCWHSQDLRARPCRR